MAALSKTVLRIACKTCGFVGPVRSISGVRASEELCQTIMRESLERASMRILARRYHKTRDTIMRIIHRVCEALPDSISLAKKLQPLWSGILVFDGKVIRVYDKVTEKLDPQYLTEDERRWIHKMRWLCGVDYGTGDLPHYDLGESENMVDLVLYFKNLKSLKYPLIAIVCDGNPLIPRAARFVFGKQIIVQRCTRHFLEDLRKLLPTEEDRKAERIQLEQLILRIKSVIETDTLESAQYHLESLKRFSDSITGPLKQSMLNMFKRTKVELTAHLLYPELKLPHTSNDIENLFKQLMQRLKTIGRFFHQTYAKNYLSAWALLRRFTPFTDCRKGRRHRNKKSPLELAGCEIQNIDPMKLKR